MEEAGRAHVVHEAPVARAEGGDPRCGPRARRSWDSMVPRMSSSRGPTGATVPGRSGPHGRSGPEPYCAAMDELGWCGQQEDDPSISQRRAKEHLSPIIVDGSRARQQTDRRRSPRHDDHRQLAHCPHTRMMVLVRSDSTAPSHATTRTTPIVDAFSVDRIQHRVEGDFAGAGIVDMHLGRGKDTGPHEVSTSRQSGSPGHATATTLPLEYRKRPKLWKTSGGCERSP